LIEAMPRPRPPHCIREETRHGKWVYYVRRWHGQRIRLRAEYDTPEWWEEYRDAVAGAATPKKGKAKSSTFRWALDLYRTRGAWAALSPATRKQRENTFRSVIATAGDEPLVEITQAAIREGRERRSATPHSANNFLRAKRGFFGWALEEKLVGVDPTKGVPILKGKNDKVGFHTWTEGELDRFEAAWPIGTRERLAYDALLYTGFRRGDAVRFGRQHLRGDVITLRTEKTGDEVVIPLLPPLAASIAATKTGDLTFLVTEAGQPWVKESFGNWFGETCRAAGCPGSAHGLRKAGASRAALNGATVNQLMAMYGWSTPKMALHYTREADRKRLAQDGAQLLLAARSENGNRPHLGSGAGNRSKMQKKSGA
jgi:integrase